LKPHTDKKTAGSAWTSRPEGGNALGLKTMVLAARWLSRPILHIMLYPIALYFFVMRRAERNASAAYLERVLGRPPRKSEVFRHFRTFAEVTADRIYFLTGETERLSVTVHQIPEMQALVDLGKGGVVLAAHIGSFEAARVLGSRLGDVTLRVVLDREIGKRLTAQLEALDIDLQGSTIDANLPAAALGLQIADSLGRGEWVGFLADRYRPGDRTVECQFLGDSIQLPLGPLIIAATFKAPLVCIFPVYANGRYEVHCEILSSAFSVPRKNRVAALGNYAQLFADKMSKYVRMTPYNWFNFYDYWRDDA
jgi:predicted LPLAT superfamily acyltransferase